MLSLLLLVFFHGHVIFDGDNEVEHIHSQRFDLRYSTYGLRLRLVLFLNFSSDVTVKNFARKDKTTND